MPEKKKVLYIITKGNFGGAQRYVYDLAANLPKNEFEAVVACGEGEALKEKLAEKNIRVIKLASSQRDINILKDVRTFFDIRKIIKEERPHIIHLNSSKIGGLGALAGRVCGVPKIIFTGHGWAFNESRNSVSKSVILFLHWITIMLCHTTIAVSEKAKKDVIWMPFVKNKIKVIYNGISGFKPLSKDEARNIFESPKPIIIYSTCELHRNKGIDVALKAIARLPREYREKICYFVAGNGEERERLESLIKELKIEDMVRLMGFVSEAKKLLSGADIFLMPSRTEAFPYSILEAGAAGLPIIASCVGGIPEVIKDMQNGILVHPKNPKEIAEAILYLMDHKEKQREFKKEIKSTIMNFFSLEKMLEETLTLYR